MGLFNAGCGGKKGGCNLPTQRKNMLYQIYLLLYLVSKLKTK